MKRRTVLIGLDGATFAVLDPLMQDGTMPFLQEFVASGTRAPLRSTIPALTPPAWTSMMTGRSPGHHGIFNFFGKEAPNSEHIRLLTSHDVGAETVWSYANRHAMRATVLNFPLTFPAPHIDGQVVAGGWMPWRQLRLGCHPPELYDRIKTLPGFNPREIAMDMAHEEKALEGCRQEEYESWIELHTRRERHWFNVVRFLIEDDPTDLITILFDGVDKLQHLCWRFLDPTYVSTLTEDWELRVRERCLNYFRELDNLLAGIVGLAGPQATVVMASDHGFGPQVRTFFVNTWLQEHGYLAWTDGEGPRPSETSVLGMGQVARHTYQLDWNRTKAFASMPGGNGIQIVRADAGHPHGVTDAEYDALCAKLVEELQQVTDPDTGEAVVAAAWRSVDVFAGPYLNMAPDITLELQDGGLFSILASETITSPRRPPSGTHRPEGIFIAGGPYIRRGIELAELSILDIAPLLLYSLDLPIPVDLEGQVPNEAIETSRLMIRPVQKIVSHPEPLSPAGVEAETESGLNEEDEEEIMRRLQALGYVE